MSNHAEFFSFFHMTQCKIRVNLGSTNFDCIFFNIWNFIAIFYFFDDKEYLSRYSLNIIQLYKLVNMQLFTLECKKCSFA